MPSKIEWCEETWSPITGCSPISEGCANCYARRMAQRLGGRFGYPADDPFRVTLHRDKLTRPIGWRKPRRIFVCSMGDLFHEDVRFEDQCLVWEMMASQPRHIFMVLTKRPRLMESFVRRYIRHRWSAARSKPEIVMDMYLRDFRHVQIGVTAENNERWIERKHHLLSTPAVTRFVSIEPMLGPVEVGNADGIHLIIVGGESGRGARPMHPEWARSVRDQCQRSGTPYFFKQWGEWAPDPRMFRTHTMWANKASTWVGNGTCLDTTGKVLRCGLDFQNATYPVAIMRRVGKKVAGRLLDGREWNEYPEVGS